MRAVDLRSAKSNDPSSFALRRADFYVLSVIVAFIPSVLIALLVPTSEIAPLIPASLIASFLGPDVLRGVLGKWDVFRPRFVVAAFLYFFLPITTWLYVAFDRRPAPLPAMADWLGSLTDMLWLYLLAVAVISCSFEYRDAQRRKQSLPALPVSRVKEHGRVGAASVQIILVAAGVSFTLFALTVIELGGPREFVAVVVDRESRAQLDGMGLRLILSEAWPTLLVLAYVCDKWRKGKSLNWLSIALVLLGFVLLQFAVGGLRGSRANTIWPLLIVLGVVHTALHRISRGVLVIVALVGIVFSFGYGLYKGLGVEGARALTSSEAREDAVRESGRGIDIVVLEDFGRLGIQSALLDYTRSPLHDSSGPPGGVPSYVGDVSILVPHFLLPPEDRPWGKTELGTQLLYGSSTVGTRGETSRIFGLAGEALLNWGPFVVPIAILGYGWLVGAADGYYLRAGRDVSNPRQRIIAGALGVSLIVLFVQDLDNSLWFVIKFLGPIILAQWVLWATRRTERVAG